MDPKAPGAGRGSYDPSPQDFSGDPIATAAPQGDSVEAGPGRGGRGGKGERNWEKAQPNPKKDRYREDSDGKWWKQAPNGGQWRRSGPPPPGHPQHPKESGAQTSKRDNSLTQDEKDEKESQWMEQENAKTPQ